MKPGVSRHLTAKTAQDRPDNAGASTRAGRQPCGLRLCAPSAGARNSHDMVGPGLHRKHVNRRVDRCTRVSREPWQGWRWSIFPQVERALSSRDLPQHRCIVLMRPGRATAHAHLLVLSSSVRQALLKNRQRTEATASMPSIWQPNHITDDHLRLPCRPTDTDNDQPGQLALRYSDTTCDP